jgi:hypothetical protein
VAAVAMVLSGQRGARGWPWWLVAGLAIGLSVGSKDTALIPGVGVLGLSILLGGPGDRLRRASWLLTGAVSLSAFWFLRTWIATGNPVFPEQVAVAGKPILTGGRSPLTLYSTPLLYHLVHGHRRIMLEWWRLARLYLGPVLAIPVLAAGGLVPRPGRRERRALLLCTLLGGLSGLAYLATPYTGGGPAGTTSVMGSQLRYAIPALYLLGICAAAACPRLAATVAAAAVLWVSIKDLQGKFRPDLHPRPVAVALAALVTLTGTTLFVVGRIVLRRSDVALAAARGAVAAGVSIAAGAAVFGLLYHQDRTLAPLDGVLSVARIDKGPVMIVGVDDVRAVMGQHFQRRLVAPGSGGAANEVPIGDSAGLDARVRELNPAAIVVGPAGRPGVLAGWIPVAYRLIASAEGDAVYVRNETSAPRP